MIGPCVRSGHCCKVRPCAFGHRRADSQACAFLGGPKPGFHYCMIHLWIKTQPHAEWEPAFGAGCCSTLNSDRLALLTK